MIRPTNEKQYDILESIKIIEDPKNKSFLFPIKGVFRIVVNMKSKKSIDYFHDQINLVQNDNEFQD